MAGDRPGRRSPRPAIPRGWLRVLPFLPAFLVVEINVRGAVKIAGGAIAKRTGTRGAGWPSRASIDIDIEVG